MISRFFLCRFVQLLLALLHVHSKNILHRDIKSQNIFLSKGGILKLGDFGISRVLNSSASMAKTMVGTPFHLSPEMCNDEPYNAKSDVWALGCLLYELITLKRAFDGNFLPAVVVKILQGKYPPIGNQFTRPLRTLVDSMLQQSPQTRPSVQDILRQTYVRQYVTRYARYMMENSEEEALSIGVEQIPGVSLLDAIQPAAPAAFLPPVGRTPAAQSSARASSSSRNTSATKTPQRDRWSANRKRQVQAQKAEKDAVVHLPDSPEKQNGRGSRGNSGGVQRSGNTRASSDSLSQAAFDISEQVGSLNANSQRISGPTAFQPRVKPSGFHGGQIAKASSRRTLSRSDSGGGAGSSSSAPGSGISSQVRLEVGVKQHELENRMKVEAQKEQKRRAAVERDRKKREEAERRRQEKEEAMEAKAREREKKMEEEKQRKARSEQLDAQLKEKERERARERKEASKRVHDFKEGLKAVRPTLRRSTLKEKGAKFAEKQAAVRPGSDTIVHVPMMDDSLSRGRASASEGSVSGSVSATPSTSQPGTPPRAEGRGGSPHVTPTKQSGVKFQGQKSPSGSQPSPQAVVANNRARRLWSRGRHGAEGAAEGGAGIAIYAPPVRVWSDTVDEDGEAGVAQEMDEVAVKAEVDVGLRDVRDFNDKVKSIWESRHAGRELLQVLDEIQDVLETSESGGSAAPASDNPSPPSPLSNSAASPGLDEVSAARIERLRLELEGKLGEDKLLQVYRVLMAAFQTEDEDSSAAARQHSLELILGADEMHLVRQVNKLILMEDKFNSVQ